MLKNISLAASAKTNHKTQQPQQLTHSLNTLIADNKKIECVICAKFLLLLLNKTDRNRKKT